MPRRDNTVLHAARLMREHGTAHLIVIADLDSPLPIGVLSSLDTARALATERVPAVHDR